MHRMFTLLLSLLVLLTSGRALGALEIVTTTADLASLAKEVGGAHVAVTAMALPKQNPHSVDPRPHLALKLARADLLLMVGLELEVGWLPTLQTGSKNGKIQPGGSGLLDCSQFVKVLEVPTAPVDRSQGDVHPLGNPHYLFDPRQAARVTKGIADKLTELDPAHAEDYRKNALAFVKRLGKATKGWEATLASARGAKVVAYHRSFAYLADWLGLTIVEHVEPRPGIPPNPHHVTHVVQVAQQQSVKVILQEAYYPSKTSELVAKQAKVTVLRIAGAPEIAQGKTYLTQMDSIVKQLAKVYAK